MLPISHYGADFRESLALLRGEMALPVKIQDFADWVGKTYGAAPVNVIATAKEAQRHELRLIYRNRDDIEVDDSCVLKTNDDAEQILRAADRFGILPGEPWPFGEEERRPLLRLQYLVPAIRFYTVGLVDHETRKSVIEAVGNSHTLYILDSFGVFVVFVDTDKNLDKLDQSQLGEAFQGALAKAIEPHDREGLFIDEPPRVDFASHQDLMENYEGLTWRFFK